MPGVYPAKLLKKTCFTQLLCSTPKYEVAVAFRVLSTSALNLHLHKDLQFIMCLHLFLDIEQHKCARSHLLGLCCDCEAVDRAADRLFSGQSVQVVCILHYTVYTMVCLWTPYIAH